MCGGGVSFKCANDIITYKLKYLTMCQALYAEIV